MKGLRLSPMKFLVMSCRSIAVVVFPNNTLVFVLLFRWVDVPRHVKVDGNEERQKIHQRDLILQQQGISFYSTRSAAKRGHVNTVETSIPPTLEAHDVSVSPLPLKGPKASQALLGMPEADLEKTNKQTGREKANADLNQKISLVSSTSPTGISGHHTRAIAQRVAPIYNVVETLAGSEQQDLRNTRPAAKLAVSVSADGQEAVSLSAEAGDRISTKHLHREEVWASNKQG
jgi:hypothetical protein